MSGFERLISSCEWIKNSLARAQFGAARCEQIGQARSHWESTVLNKIAKIKRLKAKAILLKASVNKESIVLGEATADQRLQALSEDVIGKNFLRTLALSKSLLNCYQRQDHADMQAAGELWQQMSQQHCYLLELDEVTEQRERELQEARREWVQAAADYQQVKAIQQHAHTTTTEQLHNEESLKEMTYKMEIIKSLTSCFMTYTMGYDWMKDPGQLLKLLPLLRNPPHTGKK